MITTEGYAYDEPANPLPVRPVSSTRAPPPAPTTPLALYGAPARTGRRGRNFRRQSGRRWAVTTSGWPGVMCVMMSGHGSRAGESETGGGSCSCKSQVMMITLQTGSLSLQTCQTLLWLVWNCKDDWSVSGYCRRVMRRWGQLSTWIPATLTSQWCDQPDKMTLSRGITHYIISAQGVNL